MVGRLWGFFDNPCVEYIVVFIGGVIASYIGLMVGGLLLPLLQVIVLGYFFVRNIVLNRLWRGAFLVLVWSLALTATVAYVGYSCGCDPAVIGRVVYGRGYIEEMIPWLETSRGPEGDPSLFLVPKIKEIIVFTVASLASMGLAGLFMGAVLLNYMNIYYGTLIWISNGSLVAVLMGWPIYAIIRVFGYVFLGTVLSRTTYLLVKYRGRSLPVDKQYKTMLVVALILIVLDFVLKASIANAVYQPVLHSQLDRELLTACKNMLGG